MSSRSESGLRLPWRMACSPRGGGGWVSPVLFFLLVLLTGCAARSPYQEGQAAMRARNYPEAVRLLSLEAERAPEDAMVARDLGIALIMSERRRAEGERPGGEQGAREGMGLASRPCDPGGPGWYKTYGQDTRGDGRLYKGASVTLPDSAGAFQTAERRAQRDLAQIIRGNIQQVVYSYLSKWPRSSNSETDRTFADSTISQQVDRVLPGTVSVWKSADCLRTDAKGSVQHQLFVVVGTDPRSVIRSIWSSVQPRLAMPEGSDGEANAADFEQKVLDALGVSTRAPGTAPAPVSLAEQQPLLEMRQDGDAATARMHLMRASQMMPDDRDRSTLFYLGVANEQLGDLTPAIDAYRGYARAGASSRLRHAVEDRLRRMEREQSLVSTRARIAVGDTAAVAPGWGSTAIAVAPFRIDGPEETYGPLGWALAAWLTSDLAKVRSLTTVGPQGINALVQELGLVETDSTNATHLGRVLGVARVVTGLLLALDEETMRFELRVTDVSTGVASVGTGTARLDQLSQLESDLLSGLLTRMNVQPTPQERSEMQPDRTHDLNVSLSYGRGLIAESRGSVATARSSYESAVVRDRRFGPAVEALQDVSGPLPDLGALLALADGEFMQPLDAVNPLYDRLRVTDQLTGGDLWPTAPQDVTNVETMQSIPEPPGFPGPPGTIPDPPNPGGPLPAPGLPPGRSSVTPAGTR